MARDVRPPQQGCEPAYPGLLIAAALLGLMAVAEVAFLRYVAGPDSVNLISAAEGIPTD